MDVDGIVRDALQESGARPRFDPGRWDPSVGGRRRMRRGPGLPPARWVALAVAALLLLAGVGIPLALLSGLGRGSDDGRPSGTMEVEQPERSAGTVTHSDLDDGLRITIPAAWTFHQDPTEPIEPENVFAVGSWAFPLGGVCAPFDALDDLPSDGAFFWLIEYHGTGHPEDFVPRPGSFDLSQFRYGTEYSCYGEVPQYQLRFRDEGRFFQLQVAFGPEAARSLEADVVKALDSIQATAPVPDDCPEDVGPWSHPACPEPAWVRLVLRSAGYRVTGDTGSALVGGAQGHGFYIWATEADELPTQPFDEAIASEGYRLDRAVEGVLVFTDGVRAVWTVQGLHVWVEGGPVDTLPPPEVIAELVRATIAVDYDEIDTR
ncbi:MAG: hypothetical protein ACRDI0_00395 [Actinomycetota bacterium]